MARIGPGEFGDGGSDDIGGGGSISDIVDGAADAARDAADEIGDRVSDALGGDGDSTDSSSGGSSGSSSGGSSGSSSGSSSGGSSGSSSGGSSGGDSISDIVDDAADAARDTADEIGDRVSDALGDGTDRQDPSPSSGPPVYDDSGDLPDQRSTRGVFGNPQGTSSDQRQSVPTGREITDPSVGNPDFGSGTGLDDIGGGAVDVVEGAFSEAANRIPSDPLDAGARVVGETYGQAKSTIGEVYNRAEGTPATDAIAQTGSVIDKIEEEAGEPITGPPGTVEQEIGEELNQIGEKSGEAADWTNENVVDPTAGIVSNALEDKVPLPTDQQAESIDDLTQPETKIGQTYQSALSGFGRELTGMTVGLPDAVTSGVDTAGDAAEVTYGNIEEKGAKEGIGASGAALGNTVGLVGEVAYDQAKENPVETAGRAGGAILAGLGIGKAIQRAPDAARAARIRSQGGRIYDFDEVSDPPVKTEGMGLPGFTEGAQQNPQKAINEFVEQAKQTEIEGDDPVAFHGRSSEAVKEYGGFGRSFEAPEGSSEIAGLFQSADLSRLRVPGSEVATSYKPGIPNPIFRTSRILAERDIDVDTAKGATTKEVDEFIRSEGSKSKSYVRGEDITPEQEVIAPPGSQFETSGGLFGVRSGGISIPGTDISIGGRVVTGRLTKRADVDSDTDTDADDVLTRDDAGSETRQSTDYLSGQSEPRDPFAPTSLPTGSGTTDTTETGTSSDKSGSSPSGSPTDPPTEPPTGPPTEPPTGPPSGPPTGPPTSPPSEPPTSPPTGPPSGPPTGPPSGPPTGPPTGPPSSPPSDPPSQPPQRRPRVRVDVDDDDDDEDDRARFEGLGAGYEVLFLNPLRGNGENSGNGQ